MAKKSGSGIQGTINALPKWAKILLALPVIDGFAYGLVYRMCGGIGKRSFWLVLVGFLWWFLGAAIFWIIDIICVIIKGKPTLLV